MIDTAQTVSVRQALEAEALALEEQVARLRIRQRVWPQEYRNFQKAYYSRPQAFVADCLTWKRGQGPAEYQTGALEELVANGRECVRICHGAGKAQPHDLIIDTPDGPRRFGDLEVGDRVFGADGQPTVVRAIYERGEMQAFSVWLSDGSSTLCSEDHLWQVRQRNREWEVRPLKDIVADGLSRRNGKATARKWDIPTAEPLAYGWRWTAVHPYVLGAWLGDGSKDSGRITSNDDELHSRIKSLGYVVTRYDDQRTHHPVTTINVGGLAADLRRIGIGNLGSREKYIPDDYLYNVPEVRRELLRGLLDTDGTVAKEGQISYCTTSSKLAQQVTWLCQSLGGIARLHCRHNKNGAFWIISMTLPEGRWFYVERKQARVRPVSQKRYLTRWIDRVEPAGLAPMRCISVTAPDGLYIANDCIVTHNTAEAAWAILWFALTRDGEDWKLVTTASAWRQLDKYLWPEVHKWSRRINWNKVGRGPFNERYELLKTSLSLSTGEAFAVASNMPEKLEGAHADHLFYLFDEAKTIPDPTWDAVEGAFASTGNQGIEIFALAQSTPGDPAGRFYDIQSRKPGYEDWHATHIKLSAVIAAGRVSQAWVDQRRKQWGETSAIYQNRVLGEFATNATDGIIPLTWIEASNERWLAWRDLHDQGLPGGEYPKWTGVGGDVGGGGDASTAAHRYEWLIEKIEKFSTPDTMSMVGKIVGILRAKGGYAVVDVIGIGAGVVHRAKELGVVIWPFNASLPSAARDSTKTLEFVNLRAESWWSLREQLDPSLGATLALPPDDELSGDLSVPTYTQQSNGIKVESKDDLRKPSRLGRSPDKGDAVVMICAPLTSVQGSGHGLVQDYLAAYAKMKADKEKAKKEAQA